MHDDGRPIAAEIVFIMAVVSSATLGSAFGRILAMVLVLLAARYVQLAGEDTSMAALARVRRVN